MVCDARRVLEVLENNSRWSMCGLFLESCVRLFPGERRLFPGEGLEQVGKRGVRGGRRFGRQGQTCSRGGLITHVGSACGPLLGSCLVCGVYLLCGEGLEQVGSEEGDNLEAAGGAGGLGAKRE
jgi:hypothetical protein